jgi:PBSX family phage terminase large subunit
MATQTKTPNLTAVYKPIPWQVKAWRDRSTVCLYGGAAGGGKSRAAAEKLHGFMLRYPNAVGIALRKAREFASKSVVYAIKSAIGSDPAVTYNAADLAFHYANGSRIFVAGMKDEGQRQALRSINGDGSADFIWCEEANALTEDDYNELLGRLRGTHAPWRQILLTTNPDGPMHWIKTRLMDGGEASVHYSSAIDNPYLPKEYLDILKSITGVLGMRLRDGLWVQAEGVVYPEYADALHMVERMPDGWQAWRKIRVIDFGYVNPFVCQWWAIDPDGRMYRYRELYMTQRTVAVHAEKIKLLSTGESYEANICDHDAEDRATLRDAGISNIAARKDVTVGIQAVAQRLVRAGDEKPRLYLLKGALVERDSVLAEGKKPSSTEQEFPGYVWQTTADGKPDKEEPLKVYDHGMDALRYAVMYVDNPQRLEIVENPFYSEG